MIRFLALVVLFCSVSYFWIVSDLDEFDGQIYLEQKVLELSVPIDVKIDAELIKSLNPAYE